MSSNEASDSNSTKKPSTLKRWKAKKRNNQNDFSSRNSIDVSNPFNNNRILHHSTSLTNMKLKNHPPPSTISKRNSSFPVLLNSIGGVLCQGKWHHLDVREIDIMEATVQSLGSVSEHDPTKFILDLSKIPPEEQVRQEVIYEMFVTEKEYVRDLKLIMDVFMTNIGKNHILSRDEIDLVFANIQNIHPVHVELYNRLFENRSANFGVLINIGILFMDIV